MTIAGIVLCSLVIWVLWTSVDVIMNLNRTSDAEEGNVWKKRMISIHGFNMLMIMIFISVTLVIGEIVAIGGIVWAIYTCLETI